MRPRLPIILSLESSQPNGPRPRPALRLAAMDEITFYGRRDCHLCAEARALLDALIADRTGRGLVAPPVVEHDIDADPALHDAYFDRIPVVEIGAHRLDLAVSAAKLRRLLSDALDAAQAPAPAQTPR